MKNQSFNSIHRAVMGGVHMVGRVEGFLLL